MVASDLEPIGDQPADVAEAASPCSLPLAEVASLLHNVTTLIAEADRRQGEALRELQARVEALGRQAVSVRAQVPEVYVPAFERVEDGLAQIASRLAQTEAERSARAPDSATAAPCETPALAAEEPPAEPPVRTAESAPRISAEVLQHDLAPAPLLSAVESAGVLRGSLRPESVRSRVPRDDVDTFDIVDTTEAGNADDPWDSASAEALTRVYEELSGVVPRAPLVSAATRATAAPLDGPAVNQESRDYDAAVVVMAEQPAIAAAPAPAPALDFGRDWLEARFAEIAARVEQSLADLRTDQPILSLDDRFDAIENRFGEVLQSMAARPAGETNLHDFEAHLDDLTQHVEQAQLQLQRLDTIEAQLNTVMEKLSDQRLSDILEQSAPGRIDIDVDLIAQAAAEQVAQRLAHVTPAANASPADTGRLDELRELLSSFMYERRQGEEQTVGMLDTMQQAMIRLLDRVDALELSSYPPNEPPAPEAAAYNAPEPYQAPPPPAARAEPAIDQTEVVPAAGIPPAGRLSDVTRDQLIAEARRAMQLAAAKREAEAQLESEAAKADPKAARMRAKAAKAEKTRGEGASMIGGLSKSGRRIMVGAFTLLLLSSAAVMMLMPRKPNPGAQGAAASQSGSAASKAQATARPAAAGGGQQAAAPAEVNASAAEPSRKSAGRQETPAPMVQQIPKEFLPKTVPESGVDSLSHDPGAQQDRAAVQEAGAAASFPGISIGVPAPETGMYAMPKSRELPSVIGTAQPQRVAATEGADSAAVGPAAEVTGRAAPVEMPPLSIGPSSLRQAAAKGDPSAEFEVAARFAEGKGVPQNFQQAMRWYQKSASQGFGAAQYRLGTLYERGIGTKADPARARVWYQRAADQGHVKAMHNLAVMSTAKDLAKPDYTTAARWFKEAAERGLADSQYNLAVLHESGLGVAKDTQQAYKWYSVARMAGDKEAGRRLDMLRAKIGPAEIALGEALAASFEAKPTDKLVNDAITAGEAWKTRSAQTAG